LDKNKISIYLPTMVAVQRKEKTKEKEDNSKEM
jgi:hypothetical protein